MTNLDIILWSSAGLLLTSLISIILRRSGSVSKLAYTLSFIASAFTLTAALSALLGSGPEQERVLPLGVPWLGAHFRLDVLSAFFIAVVNLGGTISSFYGIGYGRKEKDPLRILPFFAAFIAGMNLVVVADDAYSFLLSWEFMSLTSWALVMSHHRSQESVQAGYVYLIMASLGTLSLLLAFGILSGFSGAYEFQSMRSTAHLPWVSGLVLILALMGAGSKAGLVPLHVWLPLAHPAAPSHVSSLMSGVMTKVAIYGFIRIVFDLLGPPSWWWGAIVLALGGMTAVLGVLYALMQHDLKRLLAYHTVENIGIIFIGLGLAMAFEASGMEKLAALAFVAAMFHIFNHSLFKSLLFLGAGAVLAATGEKDMERLGGLIHRMPVTAFAFLAGSVAISALPPLNGFVSEWLTFQAILASPELPQWGLKILVPAVGAMLALAAALAAACFVKAFGVTFLGRPRSTPADRAAEVDRFSLASMLALVIMCLLAGIFPGYVIDAIRPITAFLVDGAMPLQAANSWLTIIPLAEGASSYNGLLVFVFIVISASLAALAIHRFASRNIRRSSAWDCGFPSRDPVLQYTAGGFAQPIRRVFGTPIFGAHESLDMPAPGEMRTAKLRVRVPDPIWIFLYEPVKKAVSVTAERLNALQFLTIRRYLMLVFVALISLLLVLVIWQ